MRPSPRLLVQLVPRNAIRQHSIQPPPAPQTQELKRPTLIDVLMERKAQSHDWPQNIRIEPVIKKQAYKVVQAGARTRLKKLLKER